jgi:hypothetical protein
MKIEVFECTSGIGAKSGKPFNIILARVEGKVGKFFSEVPYAVGPAEVEVEMSTTRDMFFSPRFKPVAK